MKRLFGVTSIAALLAVATVFVATPAEALYRGKFFGGDLDLGGRLRSINVMRHQDFDRMAFIMQRNELKLRAEWKFLQRGQAFGKYKVSWLDRADLFMVYRGIYDSVYDIKPGSIHGQKDLQGDKMTAFARSLDSLSKSERDDAKFNNRIREAYIDLYFKKLPLTLRLGKQQIVWGESDGFRMLDRANTLDLSWHFFQELPPPGFGFDEVRQPFWMIKGLWDFKQLGPLSQPFLEFFWNPGDWNPGKISFVPRPWGVNLLDPIENAQGTGVLQSSFCSGADGGACSSLLNGTELFKQGNWKRNPIENSQFGVRFHFITPGGYEWTINYLYQRWSPDGSPTAPVRGVPITGETFVNDTSPAPGNQPGFLNNQQYCQGLANSPNNIATPWGANELCVEYFAPYIHTVGASLNFFESNWTQTVWRLETVIDFDLPFFDGGKYTDSDDPTDIANAGKQTALFARAPNGPILLPGQTKKNMWKGMLAFDRPTWIKWLNKQTTFFVTGQFFWHYIINHERRRCAIDDDPANGYTSSTSENCGSDTDLFLPGEQWGLVGPLDLPKLDAPAGKGRDTIHQWELLGTLAILGFYRGGSLVPALIYLIDPVNAYSQELALGVDWFITPDIAINLSTRLIWVGAPWDAYNGHSDDDDPDNGRVFDPWFLGGGSRGRSETGLMFTWQF
jgi:hypothetical protein